MKIMMLMSNITTNNATTLVSGATIRSGPEGLVYAIMKYNSHKVRNRGEHPKDTGPFMGIVR